MEPKFCVIEMKLSIRKIWSQKLDFIHVDKTLADLLLQRRVAIQKWERLNQAIKETVKLRYRPQNRRQEQSEAESI